MRELYVERTTPLIYQSDHARTHVVHPAHPANACVLVCTCASLEPRLKSKDDCAIARQYFMFGTFFGTFPGSSINERNETLTYMHACIMHACMHASFAR